jgi:transcriptional regulator with XRE-family HTH domain
LKRHKVLPNFPSRIKQLRVKLGLTQARLAQLLDVSFTSVNRWENGQTRPSALARQRILRAEILGLEGFGGDGGQQPAIREVESAYEPTSDNLPELDFSADPERVCLVAEGERLTYGHLFNSAFAIEISLIDPLPHQRLAVYERMLPQTRLRFLLADDAGAGKTIMAGLYIREMLTRRLLRRVLIVPPTGLVGNWEREMHSLFSLPFRVVAGGESRFQNPFVGSDSDLLIVSVDTLAGDRMFSRLQDPAVVPYDLVIFDEAHKLAIDLEPDFSIRRELGSDKVFDVIGRFFEGVSLKEYMEQAVTVEGAEEMRRRIEGDLTKERVEALQERERRLFGDGGDVCRELPRLRTTVEQEVYRRLLPGFVRRFIEKAAPLLDMGIQGDLNDVFSLYALRPGALDPLWLTLETYSPEQHSRLTVHKPQDKDGAIFLHPGEPFFDRFCAYVCARFTREALRGGVFVDPTAKRPYMFHVALITVVRQADPTLRALARDEILEYLLLGVKHEEAGRVESCPVEHVLLLKGGHGVPREAVRFAATAKDSRELAGAYIIERIARPLAERGVRLCDLARTRGFRPTRLRLPGRRTGRRTCPSG